MKKTPREELMESLCENAKAFQALPGWLRSSLSNEPIFAVAPKLKPSQSTDDGEAAEKKLRGSIGIMNAVPNCAKMAL